MTQKSKMMSCRVGVLPRETLTGVLRTSFCLAVCKCSLRWHIPFEVIDNSCQQLCRQAATDFQNDKITKLALTDLVIVIILRYISFNYSNNYKDLCILGLMYPHYYFVVKTGVSVWIQFVQASTNLLTFSDFRKHLQIF